MSSPHSLTYVTALLSHQHLQVNNLYVCMCACMHVRMYVCVHVCMYVHMCACMHVRMSAYMHSISYLMCLCSLYARTTLAEAHAKLSLRREVRSTHFSHSTNVSIHSIVCVCICVSAELYSMDEPIYNITCISIVWCTLYMHIYSLYIVLSVCYMCVHTVHALCLRIARHNHYTIYIYMRTYDPLESLRVAW